MRFARFILFVALHAWVQVRGNVGAMVSGLSELAPSVMGGLGGGAANMGR
jgi:hypothetical protein